MDTLFDSKTQTKNGGRSALYFLLLGLCFGRAEHRPRRNNKKIDIVPKTSLAHRMRGNKFRAQMAGRHGGGYGRRHWIYIYIYIH